MLAPLYLIFALLLLQVVSISSIQLGDGATWNRKPSTKNLKRGPLDPSVKKESTKLKKEREQLYEAYNLLHSLAQVS